jgi:hypothetical protein
VTFYSKEIYQNETDTAVWETHRSVVSSWARSSRARDWCRRCSRRRRWVDPEAWYSAEKFSNAIHQIEREAGEKTSERAGIQMIEIIPELSGLPSIEDAIEIAQQQQRESYKNFSPEAAGQIRQERLDNGNIRIAYFGGWDYPEAFTRGIIRGFAQGTEARNSVETETVTTRDDETHAFEIVE